METEDTRAFLGQQLKVLDHYEQRVKERDERDKASLNKLIKRLDEYDSHAAVDTTSQVNEHIGPVQFNMGGIQVDADDMLRKLKSHQREPSAKLM